MIPGQLTKRTATVSRSVLALTLLWTIAGCSNSPPQNQDEPPTSATATSGHPASKTEVSDPVSPPDGSEKPIPESFDSHRFLLLAGHPILGEIQVSIDGKAPSENLQAVVDYVIAAADTDEDQNATWTELMANETFVRSPLVMPTTAMEIDTDEKPEPPSTELWASQFDANKNNVVEPAEVLPFVTDFQFNQIFVFNSGPSYGDDKHFQSTILKIIDTNRNEQFDDEELSALGGSNATDNTSSRAPNDEVATSMLMRYDYNDDETLTMDELAGPETSPEMVEGMMAAEPTTDHGDAAIIVHPDRAWIRNHFLLKRRYGLAGRLSADSLGHSLFGKLDRNEDDTIDESELQNLFTIEPEFKIQVRLNSDTSELTSDSPGFQSTSTTFGEFHTPDLSLVCGLQRSAITNAEHSGTSPESALSALKANRIQVTVSDQQDAVFSLLDTNNDGRLSLREVRLARSAIEQSDTNQDGVIFAEEIITTMQLNIRRGGDVSELTPSEIRPQQTAPSDAPEWFVAMDRNGDGELSPREFLGKAAKFESLDTNGDNVLSPAEANPM